jgi:prophage antirepressor-like protein
VAVPVIEPLVQEEPQAADPYVLEGEVVEAENVEPEVPKSKDLVPFQFENHPIRIEIGEDSEPWFIAKDVCQVLGIVNVADAVSRLDDDQKITIVNADGNPRAGIPHTLLAVNESGLYDLTLDSRKPEARRVRKWVVTDVMPAIRKTGRYQIGPPEAQVPATIDNRQLALLIESMAKRDDQFERLLVANTVEPEVSESKDIIPHEFAFKGDPVRTPLLTVR